MRRAPTHVKYSLTFLSGLHEIKQPKIDLRAAQFCRDAHNLGRLAPQDSDFS